MYYEAYIYKHHRPLDATGYFVNIPSLDNFYGFDVCADSPHQAFEAAREKLEVELLRLQADGKPYPESLEYGPKLGWSKRDYWIRKLYVTKPKKRENFYFSLQDEIYKAKIRAKLPVSLDISVRDIDVIEAVRHVSVSIEVTLNNGTRVTGYGEATCGKKDAFLPFRGIRIALFRAVRSTVDKYNASNS